MAYSLEVREHLDRLFRKLAKKDPVAHEAVERKTLKILEAPYAFKPLHSPMQWKRHVHIMGSFVLVYSVDEARKTVVLEDYGHHDKIFRMPR